MNGWNSRGRASLGDPDAGIRYFHSNGGLTRLPLRQDDMSIRMLPFSVNLTAFPTRLTITCRSLLPSVDGLRQWARAYDESVSVLHGEDRIMLATLATVAGEVAPPRLHHNPARLDLREVQDVVDQLQQSSPLRRTVVRKSCGRRR